MQDITLETAIKILTSNVDVINDFEEVDLIDSLGRVTAENYFAKFDNPPFDRSPLDGYAVNSTETPGKFKIVGEECAGDFFSEELKNGEALRIMTGSAMPKGSDCVIRQEDVTVDGDILNVPYKLNHYENYCFAGEDIKQGTLMVAKDQKLQAAHIAVLASQGFSTIKVKRQVKIAVASTGDELVLPGEELTNGKIYNSNLYLIVSRLREMNFDPKILGILPDDVDKAAEVIESHKNFDLFITTGGVSVGKKDIMHEVVKKIGEKLFWRIKMKPGAPVIGYKVENMLGIALSGNPFAAYATFELLLRPVLAKLSSRNEIIYRRDKGILIDEFPKISKGRRFIRANFVDGKISLPDQHASGSLFSATNCNALVDIPSGSGKLSVGQKVEVVIL